MNFLPVLIAGVLMGVVTSYTDVKSGFVDDKHTFPVIIFGVAFYAYEGWRAGSLELALSGLIGAAIGFALGLALYYAGVWASGDVIILTAYSALLPYAPKYAKFVAVYEVSKPLYPIAILLNSIISIFPFILVYALALMVVRKEGSKLKEVFLDRSNLSVELALWIMAAVGILLALRVYAGLNFNPVIRYVLSLAIIIVLGKFRKVGDAMGVAFLAYVIYRVGFTGVYDFLKLLAVLYAFKVFFSVVKLLREEALVEEVRVEDLKEWDILGESIYVRDGEIVRDRRGGFERLKAALMSGDLGALRDEGGEVIASPTAEGLTKEQIERLKELVDQGKLENSFLRKKSMPFAPSLFIGFLIAAFWGDLFLWLSMFISRL
ncbi:MAG: transposase [Thermococci archaeon]|nr:transposase [Thermococci archaeon]